MRLVELGTFENNGEVVVYKFFSKTCNPCKMVALMLEQAQGLVDDSVVVVSVDVEEHPDVAGEHGVFSVPTLVFTKQNKEYRRQSGFIPKEKFVELVKGE